MFYCCDDNVDLIVMFMLIKLTVLMI